ncbi:HD domain-containing protein [Chloroflexia bacterium SDU3-3]|nr:HD domain-containing protein [Chloroflexia bacterium SDU3-3]
MAFAIASERLSQQLAFILEIDNLKHILRQTRLIADQRNENSAEHSWHLALMAMVLGEHANEPVDVGLVIKMVLIHDIVEIDAGDTFLYDTVGAQDKAEREQRAADRIFGLLPADQAAELRALWETFEAQATPEARFATALDRLMPLLHNYHTGGGSWQQHRITADKVLARNPLIAGGSATLAALGRQVVAEAVAQGLLAETALAE